VGPLVTTRAHLSREGRRAAWALSRRWQSARAPLSARRYGLPRLTFVLVGRSDLYGGRLRDIVCATLEWNLSASGGEAVYVEWNPPDTHSLDSPFLTARFANLRAYVVSPARHQRLSTNPEIPAMEFFAKNAGIRRASTPWIAVINPDVALGPDLIRHLSLVRDPAIVYGANPGAMVWEGEPIGEALLADPSRCVASGWATQSLLGYCGNFLLAHRDIWHRAGGFDERLTDRRVGCDDHAMLQILGLGVRTRVLGTRYEIDDPGSWKHGWKPHHGQLWDYREGVPYDNPDTWGLADAQEEEIGERVWWIE